MLLIARRATITRASSRDRWAAAFDTPASPGHDPQTGTILEPLQHQNGLPPSGTFLLTRALSWPQRCMVNQPLMVGTVAMGVSRMER